MPRMSSRVYGIMSRKKKKEKYFHDTSKICRTGDDDVYKNDQKALFTRK